MRDGPETTVAYAACPTSPRLRWAGCVCYSARRRSRARGQSVFELFILRVEIGGAPQLACCRHFIRQSRDDAPNPGSDGAARLSSPKSSPYPEPIRDPDRTLSAGMVCAVNRAHDHHDRIPQGPEEEITLFSIFKRI